MRTRLLMAAVLCLPVENLLAQDAQPTVIRAARMLDLTSGRMLASAVVVVHGDRISAVNPASPPPGGRTVDLGDVTLLPGFIDLHTHLASEISATSFIEPVTLTDADHSFTAAANALSRPCGRASLPSATTAVT